MTAFRRLVWSLAVAALTAGGLIAWRTYPPQLAVLSGASVGVLVFFTLVSITRLRQEFQPLELTREPSDSDDQ